LPLEKAPVGQAGDFLLFPRLYHMPAFASQHLASGASGAFAADSASTSSIQMPV
jgi:hypothetical protein